MMGFFDIVRAQDDTAASRAQQAENSARWAVSQHIVETRGSGAARITEPVMFGTPFLDAPFVATGFTIKADFAPDTGWIPEAHAGVWQWHRNTKGHYTGAYVYVRTLVQQGQSEIQHHFTFSGTAYKNLGEQVATDAQLLTPRPVGFGGS